MSTPKIRPSDYPFAGTPTATPRTDAGFLPRTQQAADDYDGLCLHSVSADFANLLETELTASQSLCARRDDLLLKAQTELAAAKAERAEKQATFDLMFSANLRGIKMWQDAHPEHSETWPDLAKLVAWLLSELARLRAENKQLKADVTRETTVCDTACMEAQRLRAEVERLTATLSSIEEDGTAEHNAAVGLRQNLVAAIARAERFEAEVERLEAEALRWSLLAKSNAQAHNRTEDERFNLFLEVKKLRAEQQAQQEINKPAK